jgi:hypothetical protein
MRLKFQSAKFNKVIKKCLFILLAVFHISFAIAQGSILDANVRLNPGKQSMEYFLDLISEQTGVLFSYSSQQIDSKKQFSIESGLYSIKDILMVLGEQYGIDYIIVENQVVLKRKDKESPLEFNEKLYSISGYLYDSATGETLIGAAVVVTGTGSGTVTNAFGYYSISLPEGRYELSFSYLAFEKENVAVNLVGNLDKSIYLKPSRITLPPVLIRSDVRTTLLESSQMSRLDIRKEQLDNIPEFGGEVGLIKGLQSLPGIQGHSDGSAFFFVRGGAKDQNLIMIDDAPVYNPSHLFGYYSMVIPDFTKDIKVYKSDIPVHLGDRLSSVIDIRTKDGNLNKFHLTGMFNPLVSRLSVEGPIVKEKSSYFISFRTSNIQWIYKGFVPNLDFGFNDLNLKWNYIPNSKNRFYFSFFSGNDLLVNNISETNRAGINWSNLASSFRWNRVINSRMFANTVLLASIYQYELGLSGNKWRSNIATINLKSDFSYYPRPDWRLFFGYNFGTYAFDPGSLTLSGASNFLPTITFGKSRETSLYFKSTNKLNDHFSWSAGFRMPVWNNTGPTTLYLYDDDYKLRDTVHIANNQSYKGFIHFDPRVSLNYTIDSSSTVKFSYGSYHQYLHLLSNSTSPFTSMEVWLPSGVNIRPQRGDQVAVGYVKYFDKKHYKLTLEAYYKHMQNQIDYEPHANLLLNPLVEGELRFGKANAYGIEFLFEKTYGDLDGWVSYTYSRVFKKTKEINNGNKYPAFRDRPHDFSINLNYKLSTKTSLSANWSYYTGSAITTPVAFYNYNGYRVPLYGHKNNDRLPDYHRLDLGLKINFNPGESRFKHSLKISLYNAYGRKNAISLNYNKIDENGKLVVPVDLFGTSEFVFSQRDLLRIMPSISYKFEL